MRTMIELVVAAQTRYGPSPFLGLRQEQQTVWSTYQQVSERSCQIAHWLAAIGIRPGDRVALWANSQPRWVTTFFGRLRAGAVVVPLDVNSTPEFAGNVLARSEARTLVVGRGQIGKLPSTQAQVLTLDSLDAACESYPTTPPAHQVQPDHLAELVFTSGTTGRPKGVMLSHGNMLACLMASSKSICCYPDYRLLSLLPLSHMFEQMAGLFMPMLGGASIVYLPSLNPREVFQALQEERITAMSVVPQVLQLFMRRMEQQAEQAGKKRLWQLLHRASPLLPWWARRRAFSSVHRALGGRFQFFVSGGAFLDPSLHSKWEHLGIRVIQGYGTTEAAPVISTNSLEHRKLGSVGKPIDCLQLRIAADGEVQVRGENVTQGYWRDSERTRNAFSDGWYLTGDVGRLDKDGYLYLHGRKGDIIVLANGLNVHPEDVENVLKASPEVKDCVVLGFVGASGTRVHAVLLLEDPQAARKVVRLANRSLASHQHISGFTLWSQPDFPRTHTLKVKRSEVEAHVLQTVSK